MMIRHPLLLMSVAPLVVGSLGCAAMNIAMASEAALIAQSDEFPRRRGADLAAAAAELNVTETQLRQALGLPAEPIRPDISGAAAQLGITEDELKAALQVSHQGEDQRRRPDFATAAEQLGVSEAVLVEALGVPAERQRPDLADAAQELGVTEEQLRSALRSSRQ